MNKRIVLIDGHSLLNRAYYGMPDLTNLKGMHTNAILGFLNIMFRLLEDEQAEYLTVAFDVHAPTFRHEMFPDYKGTRKGMPEELREQVPVMKKLLKAMGITVLEQAGVEADDILGTISRIGEEQGLEVTILSGDRDLLQLATDKVKIRIPKTVKGKTEINDYYAADVKEQYQVTPLEFIDLKALMGDKSDNIPGVRSIGEKTATKIITQYGSIEEAYAHVAELKPPKVSLVLSEEYHLAQLSKVLATINTNVELEYAIENAKIENIEELYTQEAYEILQELEFKNYINRFDTNKISTKSKIEVDYKIITEIDEIKTILENVANQSQIGLSLKKQGKDVLPLFAHPSGYEGVVISYGVQHTYVLQATVQFPLEELWHAVSDCIQSVSKVSVFDMKSILPYIKIVETQSFDGIVGAYLVNPLKNNYQYTDVAREYLDWMLEEQSSSILYSVNEAYCAYAVIEPITEKLITMDMLELYQTIELPLIFTLYNMEQNGVKVEAQALKKYGEELSVKIVELEATIYEAAGEQFNINSPKQLGLILFEKLQMPHGKKTKTGYSTSAEVLDKLALEYPMVKQILEYRQLTKLKSTYADGLANYIQLDGRIHGKFNQTITATGRISSTEPNLQNIPIRMELGRLIRKVFVPDKDYIFVDADYSQIELRVLAHCSKDEQLIEAYQMESDIHKITASQVFHTPLEEVTSLQRRNAKAVNFGIVYGISAFGLSQDLEVSRKEAQEYINRYFETYPEIKHFLDETVAQAKENGYVVTEFGRRRPLPEISSSNFMQRSFGERVAMNAPIQGTAADIIKIAMNSVYKALKEQKLRSRLVLQVHDELLIEAHKEEVEIVQNILREAMIGAANLRVKLEIDMHTGGNWYEAK